MNSHINTQKYRISANKIVVGYGWDAFPKKYSGGLISGLLNKPVDVDCDGGALFCGSDGKPISLKKENCFINFANPNAFHGAVHYGEDNQKGNAPIDEMLSINLTALPREIKSIVLTLDLLKENKKSIAGSIQNTFIKIINADTWEDICRSDFHNLRMGAKLVVGGILAREENVWFFETQASSYKVQSVDEFLESWKRCSD